MHRLVTYSEIMCLPVRRAYLRLPDGYVHPIKVCAHSPEARHFGVRGSVSRGSRCNTQCTTRRHVL